MRKNISTVNALKKLDKILQLIKPKTDPRLYEGSWVNVSNTNEPKTTWKNMQNLMKEHKFLQKRYTYINRKLKSLDYEGLNSMFRDDNYHAILRSIKQIMRKTQNRGSQLNDAIREIKKFMRKLDLDESEEFSVVQT
jgi:predicted  nucleic acid-binding Zn-ribbon protein